MTSLLFSNLQKKSVINDGDLSGDLSFRVREGECLLRLPAVAKLLVGGGAIYQRKQEKSNDQRVPAIRYYQMKGPRALDMKYYLVAEGLLSWVEPYAN